MTDIIGEIGIVEQVSQELGTYPQEIASIGQMVKATILNELDFATALLYLFDEKGLPITDGKANLREPVLKPEGEVYFALLRSNFVGNASTPLIRRTCFETVGYYNCQTKEQSAGCEDRELWDYRAYAVL